MLVVGGVAGIAAAAHPAWVAGRTNVHRPAELAAVVAPVAD